MDLNNQLKWLCLSLIMGAASPTLWKISKRCQGVDPLYELIKSGEPQEMTERQRDRSAKIDLEAATKLKTKYMEKNVELVCFDDPEYPSRLKRIHNPPPVLFYRGNINLLQDKDKPVILVAGTRSPSEYSVRVAHYICGELAQSGALVLSGFEKGIDVEANKAALEAGGLSAAVCGRGINDPRCLQEEGVMLTRNGVILAEFTDRNEFNAVNFSFRNRILCGLCDAVLFVEFHEGSRGLDIADQAKAMGIPTFTIPPSDISDRRYFGQRDLLRGGSLPVFAAKDILAVLENGETVEPAPKFTRVRKRSAEVKGETEKKLKEISQEGLQESENSATIDMSELSEEERIIYTLLKNEGNVQINSMVERTKLPIGMIVSKITLMQIKGLVQELPGKRYRLK